MTTTYPKAGRLTTARAAAFGQWPGLAAPVSAVFLMFVSGSTQAAGQDGAPPIGMVEDPCRTAPAVVEGDVTAQMERMRRDWGGLCRYRDANRQLTETPVRAVFIGDSITELWGSAVPDLFRDGVINRGIGAQTSPQMLLRFYQDVIALRPRAVHIMAGTNDIAGNTGPSGPDDFKNNIRAMTELARAHGIEVVIGSIPPSSRFYWRPELEPAPRIAELNAWLRRYAEDQGAGFVDYAAAMAGPDGGLRPELSDDGVHPDTEGYAVMTPLARLALSRALSRPPARPETSIPLTGDRRP